MGDDSVPRLFTTFFTPNLLASEVNVTQLLAIIALIVFSAFFSCTETAYSCASRIKLRALASNGNKRAGKVLNLTENHFDKLISTTLVGNNIVNITVSTIATLFFAKIIVSSNVDASVISTVIMTLTILIFGEITPKFIAKIYPEKVSMTLYPLIKLFYYVFYPFNFIFSGLRWFIAKAFRLKNEDVVTEDEVLTVVEEAEEDGTLKEEETKLIRSVIEFDDLEVGDILVPRVNIVAIDVQSSMEEIRNVFVEEAYSRIPVYKDSIDTIIGTIHEKDFFGAYLAGKKSIDDIMQNAFYTTEHAKISNLLRLLQNKKVHIAVVLDEYGGTLGIVTLEDILEELVGEIWDEHDEEINFFRKISNESYVVDGKAPLSDTFEYFDLKGEDEQFDANTLSGFIIERIGEIPRTGYKLEYKNLQIEILKATVKRILQVKITVVDKEESQADVQSKAD